MRSQRQLESRIEEIFTGTKVELHQEKERQQAMVERSSSELEEVSLCVMIDNLRCKGVAKTSMSAR